ncbi:MAG: hypothetical protein H0V32_01210 [Nocardioidaceae bacterium]|nr:hypothetical protein [Nocardioidaceae bacterium]
MSRRHQALAAADLAQLPGACASCLRWERFVDRGELDGDGRGTAGEADLTRLKRRWWIEALASGTAAGIVVRAGTGATPEPASGLGPAPVGRPVAGYVTYAVPARTGGAALTVLALHVDVGCRGVGLGRALVHAVAREAVRRPRVRAVEARASRVPHGVGPNGVGLGGCLAPLDFWLACGFTVVREHPTSPRVRLDVRALNAWRSGVEDVVEQAWERVRGVVQPDPTPGPALSHRTRGGSPAR